MVAGLGEIFVQWKFSVIPSNSYSFLSSLLLIPAAPILIMLIVYLSELAQSVVDAGVVPLLVLCIQEPELALKRICCVST